MIDVLMYSTKPFEKKAFDLVLKKQDQVKLTYSDVSLDEKTADLAKNYQAICVFVNDKLTAETISKLKSAGVKLVALRCAGYNNVDMKAIVEAEMQVVRVPAYSPQAVAEFSVGLYLSLNRKIHKAFHRIHDGNYSLNGLVGHNVYGQTIGIVGTGHIGKATAQIYRGFGAKVIAYDINPDQAWAQAMGVSYVSFNDLLAQSNVVSLHAPLNSSTKYLMNEKAFATMKENSYFINTSRGGLVDTKALIKFLKNQKLAGAALDVYEEESGVFFQDHTDDIISDDVLMRLTTFPHVILTSHQAFLTEEALEQISTTTVQNILSWSRKEFLANEVKLS